MKTWKVVAGDGTEKYFSDEDEARIYHEKHGGEIYARNPCDAPVETYSRVVGFFRHVQHYNKGKKEEYKDRVTYNVGGIVG